ncbi:hypothetical protein GCM10017772_33230 [Promicromonospora soli]|uniref:Uncharacterized protein n=1 Tax=Promicromonospora soli TaxID=2035533 RepID=A0A919G1W0_9MICO|nr:hypothetical protein GCM10017772_33230 [Promicromonospora soli]
MNADAQSTTVTAAAAGTRKRFKVGGAGAAASVDRVIPGTLPGADGEVWRLSAVALVMLRYSPRTL